LTHRDVGRVRVPLISGPFCHTDFPRQPDTFVCIPHSLLDLSTTTHNL